MRILKNETILQRQSENYINGELSNVAVVVQTPQILTEWFSIDPDMSTTLDGLQNIEDYISENSTVVYNHIDNVPMAGVDNLVSQSQFDDEIGFDEDFTSSGIIFPNTIFPKQNDFFMVHNSTIPALYVVTNITPVTVRSNPFTEIQFRLYTRSPELIAQIKRQIKDDYTITVTSIGTSKSLLISKASLFDIEKNINSYLDLASMYTTFFYDENKAAFVYDGLFDEVSETMQVYIDMILWKFMFDCGVCIFDDIITYANNNFPKTIERIYTSCPDLYISDYDFNKTTPIMVFNRNSHTENLSKYRYPISVDIDTRVSKFQGLHINYIESYDKQTDESLFIQTHFIWTDDFIQRIINNTKYDVPENYDPSNTIDETTNELTQINYTIRNAIISWYHNETIDFDNIVIAQEKTIENYELIPFILQFYKIYIYDLQK